MTTRTPINRRQLSRSKACRFCGRPSFVADAHGPAHQCCRWWIGELGWPYCVACATSGLMRRSVRRQPPLGAATTTPRRRSRRSDPTTADAQTFAATQTTTGCRETATAPGPTPTDRRPAQHRLPGRPPSPGRQERAQVNRQAPGPTRQTAQRRYTRASATAAGLSRQRRYYLRSGSMVADAERPRPPARADRPKRRNDARAHFRDHQQARPRAGLDRRASCPGHSVAPRATVQRMAKSLVTGPFDWPITLSQARLAASGHGLVSDDG
jgi:hypothetical protein